MSQKIRKSSQIAKRYASSLLDLAAEKPGLEAVENDVRSLLEVIEGSQELTRALSDPRIKTPVKQSFMADIVKRLRLNEIILNFLRVLAENDRLSNLKPVLGAVLEEVKTRRGIVDAQVYAAQDLDKTLQDKLKKSIVKACGSNVDMRVEKDESLLGGLVVQVGSLRVDDSIKNKLARLENQMISGHNQQPVKEVA